MILSVAIAVLVGTFGLFGFATGNASGYRTVEARVVEAKACDPAGAMETVEFTVDGRQRRAQLDGCGHQQDEQVSVSVPANGTPDMIVRFAGAYTGEADSGRGLGLLLLAIAGIAGGGYGLLLDRAMARRLLGTFTVPDLTRLFKRRR